MLRSKPRCYECSVEQMYKLCSKFKCDVLRTRELVESARKAIESTPLHRPPAEITMMGYREIARGLGDSDLYAEEKAENNQVALGLLPDIRSTLEKSDDRIGLAIRLAVLGNLYDLALVDPPSPEEFLSKALGTKLVMDGTPGFLEDLKVHQRLLYIGDNAGEIVFDMLLVEELKRSTGIHVTFAVRGGPVMNDATMADADMIGLHSVARVITTGSDYLGVSYEHCSRQFAETLRTAEIVLAKGHANFETMPDRPGPTYHLLTVKCEVVAAALGVEVYDSVLFKRPEAE